MSREFRLPSRSGNNGKFLRIDTNGGLEWAVGSQESFTTSTDPATDAAVTTAIIDANDGVVITLTGAGNDQTLQSPTDTTSGRSFVVVNDDTSTDPIDIIDGTNTTTLGVGEAQRFVWDGSAWARIESGIGDFIGPASSTDNAIVRFDGSNGKLGQNSSVTIDDSNNITGASGGMTLTGGTGASDDLTLSSTSNATKGNIVLGSSAYDETNDRLGIGTTSPAEALDVVGKAILTDSTPQFFLIENDAVDNNYRLQTANGNFFISEVDDSRSLVSHRLLIDSDGNVGIGVTSPSSALNLPQENDATTPTLSFGDGNTGFYEVSDNVLGVSIGGTQRWEYNGHSYYGAASGDTLFLRNVATSDTVPGIGPRNGDLTTGMGANADGEISLIASSVEKVRIDGSRVSIKDIFNFELGSELTISGGVITIDRSYHTVDTEGDTASDNLDTINGGSSGDILILRAANDARTVLVKDGTGNLSLGGDFSMDDGDDTLVLLYNGTGWLEISRTDNKT